MGNNNAKSVIVKFSDSWMKEVLAHSDDIKIPPQQPSWPYEKREVRVCASVFCCFDKTH